MSLNLTYVKRVEIFVERTVSVSRAYSDCKCPVPYS